MSRAKLFILMTVMIDAMGLGLIIPVMPALIKEVTGGNLADAALWGGILATCFAVMQFLFAPFLGALSDRYGRRPVLLSALTFMAVDYVIQALAQTMWLLFLGRIIAGITAATHSTAAAAMADLSPAKDRAAGFGMVSAGFGIGFVLGPVIGGMLGEFGTRAPFWAAAVLAGLNACFGYWALPETVTDRTRRAFEIKRANPFGAFKALKRLPGVARGLAIFFLYQLAFGVYPAIWPYFGQARFGWDSGTIGLSLGLFGISMALFQGVLIRPILARLGEYGTGLLGLSVSCLSFVLIAIVPSGAVVLALTPLAALGSVFTPALQGGLSRQVDPSAQGELQGVLGSASAVAMIVAPLIMTPVFALFTTPTTGLRLPGAPFLLACALTSLALLLYLRQQRAAA